MWLRAEKEIAFEVTPDIAQALQESGIPVEGLVSFLAKVLNQYVIPMAARRLDVDPSKIEPLLANLTWKLDAPPDIPENAPASYSTREIVRINVNYLHAWMTDDSPLKLAGAITHELEHWFYDLLTKVPGTSRLEPMVQDYEVGPGVEKVYEDAWFGSKDEQSAEVAKYRSLLELGFTSQELLEKVPDTHKPWVEWILELAQDASPQTIVSDLNPLDNKS